MRALHIPLLSLEQISKPELVAGFVRIRGKSEVSQLQRRVLRCFVLLFFLIGQSLATFAQEENTTTPSNIDFPNARVTMDTFLKAANQQDWERAASCLDLSELSEETTQGERNDLAFELKEVIDRIAQIDIDDISDDAGADPYRLEVDSQTAIEIAATDDGNWLFTAATVQKIGDLYKNSLQRERVAGYGLLEGWFHAISPTLTAEGFLLPHYQWICLLVLIFLGFLADVVVRFLLGRLVQFWFKIRRQDGMTQVHKLWKPLGLLTQALVWYGGTLLIGLPPKATLVLKVGLKFFAVIAAVWTAFRSIDLLGGVLVRKAMKTDTKFDDLLVPLITKSLKVFAICMGVLVCAEAFNLPISGLLGGFGIASAAIAFASKDAISNFFGSVTVLTDRPFEIGDWIITDGAEGTVESVGFRSTRIRTFYNSQITLPNSLLTTAIVDNMGRRRYRRIKAMLGVQYDTTPDQMEAFCEGIREIIRRHPYTRKDYYHVYFNDYGDSSLNILLYCFVECPDWSVELREKHRLFVDIMILAERLGISFAFPTRTLHMYQEQHSAATGGSLSDPLAAGQRLAAEIAGPPLPPHERPGGVVFGDATPFPVDKRESIGGDGE